MHQRQALAADHTARYAETQSLRSEHASHRAEPVRHLRVVADEPVVQAEVSQTRVSVYFLIAAILVFAARYMGVIV
jgi:hypothetical protein